MARHRAGIPRRRPVLRDQRLPDRHAAAARARPPHDDLAEEFLHPSLLADFSSILWCAGCPGARLCDDRPSGEHGRGVRSRPPVGAHLHVQLGRSGDVPRDHVVAVGRGAVLPAVAAAGAVRPARGGAGARRAAGGLAGHPLPPRRARDGGAGLCPAPARDAAPDRLHADHARRAAGPRAARPDVARAPACRARGTRGAGRGPRRGPRARHLARRRHHRLAAAARTTG